MLPLNELSSSAVTTGYPDPVKLPGDFLIDYERGGIALNDPSQGLEVQIWKLEVRRDVETPDLLHVWVKAPLAGETLLFSGEDITEAALSFDQNMNPFVAYVQDGDTKIYWYDSSLSSMTTTNFGPTYKSPRCTIDEKRTFNSGLSDNLFSYIRDGFLRVRYQRDRYTIERTLCEVGNAELVSMAMNSKNRIQWRIRNATADTDDGRFKVQVNPLLADVVLTLCIMSGIPQQNVDVSELYEDEVAGLKIDTDEGLDQPIDWLRSFFFFDKAEYDKKIHWPKRGRNIAARIPYSHLQRGNPTALKMTLINPLKIPSLVNVKHLDPDAGFAPNQQTAARRSNIVQSKKKETIDSKVVLTADQAATAAWIKLKMYWNEQIDYEFKTTIRYSELTVGDVIQVEDAIGTWHTMRIEERNEDGGILSFDGRQDAGTRAYGSKLRGNALPTPISTTPGLVGETNIEILNISPQLESHDELGLYVAASGDNSAWTGFQLLVSIDGGFTYSEVFRTESPSTIGISQTDFLAEDQFSPSSQALDVLVNFPLSSISSDQLYKKQNRAIIGDECIQFKTATLLGMVDEKYSYRLSGIVRARYGSEALHWPSGTRFVLFDDTVTFVPLPKSMLNQDVIYKPVSFGLLEDETTPVDYLFDTPTSQLEWKIFDVKATRASGNVTVNWIGRKRLGFDTAPYNSKYFTGYRVKFSDGHTIDVAPDVYSASYNSAPVGVTVQICGLNSITGEGPYSDPIST